MKLRQTARGHNEAAVRSLCEGCDGPFNVTGVTLVERIDLDLERRCRSLNETELGRPGWRSGIAKDRDARDIGRDLLEQLEPFCADAVFEKHETGGIAAWPREAVDEACRNRISNDRENDRHGAGRLQQRGYGSGAMGQNDVRRERDQFRSVLANFGGISTPARVDPRVAADSPA